MDEAFFSLVGFEKFGFYEYGLKIAKAVTKNTGIPVSIGIAPNKTLAKVANRFAKKYPRFRNVFIMDSELKRVECLKRTKIGDVWGVGPELREKLYMLGVFSAWDFLTKVSQMKARKIHNVELERTWCELQGMKCYEVVSGIAKKKSLVTSRSLPHMVEDKESLRQALSTYAAICAADLRKEKSYAVSIRIGLQTNRFRDDQPQYNPYTEITLPFPSNTTLTLAKYALQALDDIFLEGFKYKKVEMVIPSITKTVQTEIYHPIDRELKYARISPVEDFYAHGFDRKLCALAVMGFGDRRHIDLKQENPLRCPTTRFSDILVIDCCD